MLTEKMLPETQSCSVGTKHSKLKSAHATQVASENKADVVSDYETVLEHDRHGEQ